MSKNKVLDYLSAVYEEIDAQRDTIDMELSEHDDGEPYSVAEGKAEAKRLITNAITRLQKLRVDIENMGHKTFCVMYDITDRDTF